MKSVKLNFLLIFFLILGLSYQGYADCPTFVESNTWLEAIVGGDWVKEIKVQAIKNQGVDGYFNPKIRVCAYDGKSYCYDLQSGESCRQIYGTQSTGGGVSAAVFIDWEGDKMLNDGAIHGQMTQSLKWEWAAGVSDDEKIKFANSPKICACSQKGACMSGISATFARWGQGANIFRPGEMAKVCDTCYQTKVKCAPVPLAPAPPPFCEQLAMSPPQVRIVPITNKDNDYFNPKIKVIIGDLKGENGEIGQKFDFPKKYGENKAEWRSISDKDGITYYFKTYREKDKLCTEYSGTQSIDEKNLQFVRCFPAPPAPEPKVVKIVNGNTLEIEMKMSENTCTNGAHGTYSNGSCTFNVNTDHNHPINIGPLSLKVVKPRIVKKTTNSNNNESNIGDVIESIFKNSSRFTILEQYGYVPNIRIKLPNGDFCSLTNPKEHNKCKPTKLELDNMGQPKIEVRYMQVRDPANSNSKMLCLSGWQPEPEEFVLKRGDEIIPLKLMGTKYIKYNAVYSKESNQFYYLPSKEREIVDLLKRPQDQLDKIIFNKQGYVFFPDENKQEKGKCSYCVKRNDEIDETFESDKGLKVVYKLTDVEHKKGCDLGADGCICFNGTCSRSTQYLNKKDGSSFYLKYEEVDCKDKNGEEQKCTQLKDQLIKADRTEVFYADKLCRFDLEGLKEKLKEEIKKQLENKEQEFEKKSEKSYDFKSGNSNMDGSQITSSHVEIEVWGCGEAGHIKDTPTSCTSHIDEDTKKNACSTETRAGMPGDYIKAELEIDLDYPIIDIEVSEGGGNQESRYTDKDGGPIFIKKCRLGKRECKNLIIMGGGGIYKAYPSRDNHKDYKDYMETIIDDSVKLKEKIIIKRKSQSTEDNKITYAELQFTEDNKITYAELQSTEDNKITYIENGKIKYETVECRKGFRSNKPGAGGCINKSQVIYGKGSAGYVKITPIIKGFDINIINDAIEKMIGNRYDLGNVRDFLTSDVDTSIIKMIEEEIKKELLGK